MSWDAIVVANLTFPNGGVEAWMARDVKLPKLKWPGWIASYTEDDGGSVADRVESCQRCDGTLVIDITGNIVSLRGFLPKDGVYGVVNDLLRLVGAAVSPGVTGRLVFGYAGTGFGHDDGVELLLRNGKLTVKGIPSGGVRSDDIATGEAALRAPKKPRKPPPRKRPKAAKKR